MKLDDFDESGAVHACVYGEPFTGKTTLVTGLIRAGYKAIWISLDSKAHLTLRKLSPEERGRVDFIRIPDRKEDPVGITTCLKIISGAEVKICDAHGRVTCRNCTANQEATYTTLALNKLALDTVVVFDHISQIAESAMVHVIMKAIANGDKDATGTTEKDPDMFKPGYTQYMLQGFLMNKFLTNIMCAPYHCVCIAHVVETELENGEKKLVPQIGSGPYSRNSPKFFDHLIACRVQNSAFKFGSNSKFSIQMVAGSATDVDINTLGEPTFSLFFPPPSKEKGKIRESEYGANVARTLPSEVAAASTEALSEVERKVADVLPKVINHDTIPSAGSVHNANTNVGSASSAVAVSDSMKAMLAKLKRQS